MPRQPRIEFADAVYYLVNRGNGGQPVFVDDADRERFRQLLGEACAKTGWRALAWCLLPDEIDLLVQTPQPNLVTGMKWLLGTYTIRFNRRHRRLGHLFAGRYRSVLVEPGSREYLPAVCHFIHLRPAAAGLVPAGQPLGEYPWSSFRDFLRPADQRPAWLAAADLFSGLGLPDQRHGYDEFERLTESRRNQPPDPCWRQLERGWCLGGSEYRRMLLAKLADPAANSGAPRREIAREQAELILREELERLGWDAGALAAAAKSDPEKIRIARRLRAETTISLRWVAQRLKMGSWTHAANCLYRPDDWPMPKARPTRPRPTREHQTPSTGPAPSAVESPQPVEELPVHCL